MHNKCTVFAVGQPKWKNISSVIFNKISLCDCLLVFLEVKPADFSLSTFSQLLLRSPKIRLVARPLSKLCWKKIALLSLKRSYASYILIKAPPETYKITVYGILGSGLQLSFQQSPTKSIQRGRVPLNHSTWSEFWLLA